MKCPLQVQGLGSEASERVNDYLKRAEASVRVNDYLKRAEPVAASVKETTTSVLQVNLWRIESVYISRVLYKGVQRIFLGGRQEGAAQHATSAPRAGVAWGKKFFDF